MTDTKDAVQELDFDVGTSPHGLSAEYPPSSEETCSADSLDLLEDGFGLAASASQASFSEHGEQAAPAVKPEVYRLPWVRSCCRSIKAAVLKQTPGVHRLALDDCEFLHLFYAVEHDRNKTRKAIGKGRAVVGDLRATDTLWHKLQTVMAFRMRGAR